MYYKPEWQFLRLDGQILSIDLSEYYLKDVNKILGILASGILLENNEVIKVL